LAQADVPFANAMIAQLQPSDLVTCVTAKAMYKSTACICVAFDVGVHW